MQKGLYEIQAAGTSSKGEAYSSFAKITDMTTGQQHKARLVQGMNSGVVFYEVMPNVVTFSKDTNVLAKCKEVATGKEIKVGDTVKAGVAVLFGTIAIPTQSFDVLTEARVNALAAPVSANDIA